MYQRRRQCAVFTLAEMRGDSVSPEMERAQMVEDPDCSVEQPGISVSHLHQALEPHLAQRSHELTLRNHQLLPGILWSEGNRAQKPTGDRISVKMIRQEKRRLDLRMKTVFVNRRPFIEQIAELVDVPPNAENMREGLEMLGIRRIEIERHAER